MHSIHSNRKDFLRSQSLTRRRRKRKIIRLWIMFFCICALFALVAWLISLQSMAIKKIVVVGNANITSEEIQRIGNDILDSKYIGLFSKRNAFLYPKKVIAQTITQTYPRISNVGIETESLEILNIKIKEREAVAIWCAAVECYQVDESGYIFAEYHEPARGSTIQNSEIQNTSAKENEKLPVLYGGDQFVGPEPIGKSIFNKKLYLDIRNTLGELEKSGLFISSIHVYSRDEIVFTVSTGGKLIFSDRKPFEAALEDLKSSLKSSVFNTTKGDGSKNAHSITPVSSSSSKIVLPPNFEYIDVRFGNKVFYKMDKTKGENDKTSSTTKSEL